MSNPASPLVWLPSTTDIAGQLTMLKVQETDDSVVYSRGNDRSADNRSFAGRVPIQMSPQCSELATNRQLGYRHFIQQDSLSHFVPRYSSIIETDGTNHVQPIHEADRVEHGSWSKRFKDAAKVEHGIFSQHFDSSCCVGHSECLVIALQ